MMVYHLKLGILLICIALATETVAGQTTIQDSVQQIPLQEITVIHKVANEKSLINSAQSIDKYLANQEHTTLIKRGAYAWEPMLNNMSTERTKQTIDGMQIFHACTDKMDPITAYVEGSNLESISITSGTQGALYGPTLGGSLDLKTKQLSFIEDKKLTALAFSGFQTNEQLKHLGTTINYSSSKWAINTSATWKDAENYKAGKQKEVLYSQYKKLNLAAKLGYKIQKEHFLELATIYDKATDVGYPALPMDVSLAEALITSLTHSYKPANRRINNWSNKLYFNTITHRMDDTSRPDVFIRMDMPGKTNTYGFLSTIDAVLYTNHQITTTLSAYHNKSHAEMTMFAKDPNHKDMFALTWPNIQTNYLGSTIKDRWQINRKNTLLFTIGIGIHHNKISNEGVKQLSIFYNDTLLKANKTRAVGNFAINYTASFDQWQYSTGIGYGNRAPAISEAYGYYLFNSSDKYDYIGNPKLKNEETFELNSSIKYTSPGFSTKLNASFFHLNNYIIGVVNPIFNAMTYGGNGVKLYENIDYAIQGSVAWDFLYKITQKWGIKGGISYHYGKDSNKNTLPFISPIAYHTGISYSNKQFQSTINIIGNTVKNKAAIYYGETKTPAYTVLNWEAQYTCLLFKKQVTFTIGADNIFDTYYTTYADWNHIPNPGRNFTFKAAIQL